MTMICARCNRPLFRLPGVTIPSRSGVLYMGPKCAEIAGLVPAKRPRVLSASIRAAVRDIRQLDWVELGREAS